MVNVDFTPRSSTVEASVSYLLYVATFTQLPRGRTKPWDLRVTEGLGQLLTWGIGQIPQCGMQDERGGTEDGGLSLMCLPHQEQAALVPVPPLLPL
ncbi:hypothetical protein P7K49_004321 [Saguinus oedipus]|uniref:Uncharacterized protein n=1 Tax=Saguinus oedipus TaxID=9490 RepID=A0ABQ9W7N4_SAGOE|nr:hypothetical protein P7K49_004321 [Saguinus oedipus]